MSQIGPSAEVEVEGKEAENELEGAEGEEEESQEAEAWNVLLTYLVMTN